MTAKMRVLLWFGLLLTLFVSGLAIFFLRLAYSTAAPQAIINDLIYVCNSIILAAVAMPICLRQPHNPVGWILLLAGFFLGLQSMSQYYTIFSWLYYSGELPGTIILTWLAQWTWLPPYTLFMLLLLLFPGGKFLSPIWRWVGVAVVASTLLLMLLVAISSPLVVGLPGRDLLLPNPLGLWVLPTERWEFLFSYFWLPLLLLILLSAVSITLRWRGAAADERQQFKVVVYAVTVIVVTLITGTLVESTWYNLVADATFLLLPFAFALAILRYRLYDIDVVIRKTVVYTVVSGLLALIYFSSVVLLQRIFMARTGQGSPVAIVVSTLLIAALFTPLRRRVQTVIDRRFFRRRYDMQEVLASFGTAVRNETDPERLTAELMHVVQETMQPATVGVWINPRNETWRP